MKLSHIPVVGCQELTPLNQSKEAFSDSSRWIPRVDSPQTKHVLRPSEIASTSPASNLKHFLSISHVSRWMMTRSSHPRWGSKHISWGFSRLCGRKNLVRGPLAMKIPGSFARRQSLIPIFVPRIQWVWALLPSIRSFATDCAEERLWCLRFRLCCATLVALSAGASACALMNFKSFAGSKDCSGCLKRSRNHPSDSRNSSGLLARGTHSISEFFHRPLAMPDVKLNDERMDALKDRFF